MRKLSVLVVDDNLLFLSAVRNLLIDLPEVASIECVNSGAEALSKVAEFCPDLVLMDIMMPGFNGLETIRVLHDRLPALRIYAVTLHDADEYRAEALKSGADKVISKHDFGAEIPDLIAQLARDDGIAAPSA